MKRRAPVAVSLYPPPPPPAYPMQSFGDLEEHLIAVFFAAVNTALPIIDEAEFLEGFVTCSKQPLALLSAMRGAAVPFSNHPTKAHMEEVEDDALRFVQTAILLALWNYGAFLGTESQMERSRVHGALSDGHSKQRRLCQPRTSISIWLVPRSDTTDWDAEARFRAFAGLFFLDTMVLMVSGLDPTMEENENQYQLIVWEARLRARREAHQVQLAFIIRKVCRYSYLTSITTGDQLATVPVLKLLAKPLDPDSIHEALMDFYASIPAS
ncbi:hypothetical protein HDU96_002966 [Phlyctochytrium bullatum]|nr:hypothetical protein HDU96_002966 [Phlyctochytrium bullatum]